MRSPWVSMVSPSLTLAWPAMIAATASGANTRAERQRGHRGHVQKRPNNDDRWTTSMGQIKSRDGLPAKSSGFVA
jgi:hypothetical protein